MPIKKNYVIEKSNVLVELKNTHMTLQELRFFCIYMSKINARDVSTRRVRFPMSDFQKIMGFGKLNIKQLQQTTNKLLCKVVNIPNADGGYTGFTLFNLVRVFKDDFENWNLEIDASEQALPLFFNLKGNYLTYELWNVLNLKSVNQVRMYELLKRYEKLGVYEIKISDLREYLEISSTQYLRMEHFKTRILNDCQKALAENTDICYTYECGKRGARGKWLTIVFHISKNDKHSDPMELQDFIDKQPQPKPECVPDAPSQPPELPQGQSERQPYLSGEFEKDLEPDDIKALCDILANKVPASERKPERLRTLLKSLYSEMILKSKEPVKKPVSYLLRMINNTDSEELEKLSSTSYSQKKGGQYGSRVHYDKDFDVDKYKIFINDFTVI
ncbi:MAG: replication initiation protein [Ruminococcus sp.]|nr:replication initiation protein [Ruminococcus sp.]